MPWNISQNPLCCDVDRALGRAWQHYLEETSKEPVPSLPFVDHAESGVSEGEEAEMSHPDKPILDLDEVEPLHPQGLESQ